ncbi:hypothetical protein J3E68DRAFT_420193, partial [Trichoderma sp. SZMC 28012]
MACLNKESFGALDFWFLFFLFFVFLISWHFLFDKDLLFWERSYKLLEYNRTLLCLFVCLFVALALDLCIKRRHTYTFACITLS